MSHSNKLYTHDRLIDLEFIELYRHMKDRSFTTRSGNKCNLVPGEERTVCDELVFTPPTVNSVSFALDPANGAIIYSIRLSATEGWTDYIITRVDDNGNESFHAFKRGINPSPDDLMVASISINLPALSGMTGRKCNIYRRHNQIEYVKVHAGVLDAALEVPFIYEDRQDFDASWLASADRWDRDNANATYGVDCHTTSTPPVLVCPDLTGPPGPPGNPGMNSPIKLFQKYLVTASFPQATGIDDIANDYYYENGQPFVLDSGPPDYIPTPDYGPNGIDSLYLNKLFYYNSFYPRPLFYIETPCMIQKIFVHLIESFEKDHCLGRLIYQGYSWIVEDHSIPNGFVSTTGWRKGVYFYTHYDQSIEPSGQTLDHARGALTGQRQFATLGHYVDGRMFIWTGYGELIGEERFPVVVGTRFSAGDLISPRGIKTNYPLNEDILFHGVYQIAYGSPDFELPYKDPRGQEAFGETITPEPLWNEQHYGFGLYPKGFTLWTGRGGNTYVGQRGTPDNTVFGGPINRPLGGGLVCISVLYRELS